MDEEGICCFASMTTVYMISAKLEHHTCIVNLLGPKPDHLQEAKNMVMAMPCKTASDCMDGFARHFRKS
jgi:hypothetical protein